MVLADTLAYFARESGRYDNDPVQTSGLRLPSDGVVEGTDIEISRTVVVCPTYFSGVKMGRFEVCRLIMDAGHAKGRRYTWMSDSPQEVMLAKMDAKRFPSEGRRILVMGLGLGIFPQLVEGRYQEVVVLEISPAVVKAVWDHVAGGNWRLVVGDAWRAHRLFRRGTFDHVYADIWSEINSDNHEAYKAMKKLARFKLGAKKTVCWAEDEVYRPGSIF